MGSQYSRSELPTNQSNIIGVNSNNNNNTNNNKNTNETTNTGKNFELKFFLTFHFCSFVFSFPRY